MVSNLNIEINGHITSEEILHCVKNLKNENACGDDIIKNEYIKSSIDVFLPVYLKLFNCIFDSGIILESWLTGNVKPIYKNKGNHLDPKKVRPITILNCFGKLFTAVLLTRLNAFSEKFSILNENQSGFRKGYSTIDNIFAKKEKVIVTFVDFEKAFGKVWRDGLWCKLLLNNIMGRCIKLFIICIRI